MITRLTGLLESVDGLEATIVIGDLAYQVLLPAYEAARLGGSSSPAGTGPAGPIGQTITLHTIQYLENQGQGSSYIPRLIGFATPQERRFFELLTTMDGFGNRRALRAMAHEPTLIARAILSADAAWLTRLPEIGKKTAEKVILELKGKVQPFLTADEVRGLESAARSGIAESVPLDTSAAAQAIAALIALGEMRADAERMVRHACARDTALAAPSATAEEIIAAAYGGAKVGR